MVAQRYEFTVELDGDEPFVVVADQRDLARWEVQPFGCATTKATETSPVLWVRYLAWSASTRQGDTTLSWDAWQQVCVDVAEVEQPEDAVGDEGVDPGQPDPSGSPSSGSPSVPGRPSRARRGSKAGTRAT